MMNPDDRMEFVSLAELKAPSVVRGIEGERALVCDEMLLRTASDNGDKEEEKK